MKLKIVAGLLAAHWIRLLLPLQAATASPIADALAEKVLPGDASLTSYTIVQKAVEQADASADDAWRKLKTREKYDAYRARMRSRMVEAVGGFPARTPLNAQVRGNVVRDGYRVEKIVYESLPGVYVTANLYLPDERKFKPPYPAFLVTCGHSGLGKCDEDYSRVCVMAAHQGLASLIYDPLGQGERMRDLQMPNVEGHNRFGALAILLGRSTAQFRIWDGIRSMDYLDTRPDIRHNGYGYMGNSGGGTMTSLIMALDPRVKAAAPSCYLSTIRDVFSHVGPQDAEQNVFGQLAFGLNHASFVLMGGNAVRMHCCHGDFFPFEGSQKTWRTVNETAANCGLGADRYGITDVPGPHGWKESARTSSVQWMRRWLLGDASALPIDVQACRALDKGYDWKKVDCGLCGDTHKVLSSGDVTKEPGFKSIYEYLREDLVAAEKRRRKMTADETAVLVAKTAGIRPLDELGAKAKVVSSAKLDGVTVSRVVFELPSGLQMPSVVFRPAAETGSPVIVLGCAKRSDHFARVEKLLASGRAVMVADVIGTGEIGGRKHSFYGADNPDEEIAVMLYCLGRSLVGERAEEIVMLADYMKKLTSRTPDVVAHDRTTIPALHARAVRRDLIGSVELIRPPLSWGEAVRKSVNYRFANAVNGALLHYDWTDLGKVTSAQKVTATNDLTTSWGRAVTPENVWREYPRPQLVRKGWTCLNGTWEYAIVSAAADEPVKYDGTILVPFGVETPLSGVRRKVLPEDQIWYRRTFTARPRKGYRTILNLERVDFRAQVFVNGQEATDVPHEGGNAPFSVDVTPFVKDGENELKVLVWDPTDAHLGCTGKQVLKLKSCFFPATSGICGSVWMETVPETYLADYKVETDAGKGTVTVTPFLKGKVRSANVTVCAYSCGKPVSKGTLGADSDSVTLTLPKPLRLWSCETPNLYGLKITVVADGRTDLAKGYFGIRTVGTKLDAKGIRRATVNGEFTYFLATLDQGWWPDGYLTPPSEDALRFDVDFHKKAGFNAIRKHIKIEPRAFYAHCDRVGIMVLQDIPSCRTSDLQDDLQYANRRYGLYRHELKEIVDHLRNHPSVVMWIPYNEGWGQPSADKTRFTNRWLKRYDPSRLLDGPSGWNDYDWKRPAGFKSVCDVVDCHHYPDARMFKPNAERMTMAGEFGGVCAGIAGHYQDLKGDKRVLVPVDGGDWRERIAKRYEAFMKPVIKMAREGLGGSVYTEAIDQFWESGGFVTFDRAVVKFDYEFLRTIHKKILDAASAGAAGR